MASAVTRNRISGLEWIDRLKGVAMLWVVLNHVVEQLAGGNFAGDPTGTWPPLLERINQFKSSVSGFGALDLPLTGLRDVGWLADQAVTIFIVLSGFGLALGLIAARAKASIDARSFFGRRLQRIYPFWWGAHVLFLPTGYLFASGLSTGDWQYYASFLGLRFIPGVFSYFSGSWWYVGVIIQLYIAFPVLWWIMRARGPVALLAVTWGLGFLSLAIGHAVFHGDLVEMWQRGIFAITRLPEFAFGMAFALWWAHDPARGNAFLRREPVRAAAAVAYAAGFALSFTLPGMIVAPTMLGISAIVLLYPIVAWRATGRGPLEFIGRHSFTIYLTHQYLVVILVRPQISVLATAAAIVCALLATAAATFVLERGTTAVEAASARLAAKRGRAVARLAIAGTALAIVGLPLAVEGALKTSGPQDSSRWSERIALVSDPVFGWRFLPSRTIRLERRADYQITSNADGFPGPDWRQRKPDGALRVLVVGDAISTTSVDDVAAWPHVLQMDLARLHRPVEVGNFAVSGYGPNQEASVAQSFAPLYRPDVVVVEVYPDDVQDVLTDTATLQREMGVDRPPPGDVRSVLSLERLRAFLPWLVVRPLGNWLHQRPSTEGYFLGQFVYLERGHDDWDGEAVRKSADRYRNIAQAARQVGARTILVFVPGPAQVCGPQTLSYYPHRVALADASKYDVDLPDRRARRIAAQAHLELLDLSPNLRSALPCAYAPDNRYLRPEAHEEIAALLAQRLLPIADERLRALRAKHDRPTMPQVSGI